MTKKKSTAVKVVKRNVPKTLQGKKRQMMDALITSMGNITKSAQKVGISRCTHYEWMASDPLYKREYESLDDLEVDFYRAALHQLVQEKNVTAVIFGLKTKGKHRGYVERQEIEHSGAVANININLVEKSKEELRRVNDG